HEERLPTFRNAKHGQQWINTLSTYAFPQIGGTAIDRIGQPEVLACLSPIWTSKHETAKRLAQRIKTVLDVARSRGLREGENPVTAIREGGVLPKVRARATHHRAMRWQDVPDLYARLRERDATAARALMFTCLTAARTGEVLGARWAEIDLVRRLWTVPAERMKAGAEHRVPLTEEMLTLLGAQEPLGSEVVFEGQKRHAPLSNMSMVMLLRRMGIEGVTVHGFRSSFRDWAGEAGAPREVAEMCLAHRVGSAVEQSYARSDLLERRRRLMEEWSRFVASRG
ncbi:tyrosine-type recombinase/integrase, partial [Jannaschia aquimarina]